MVRRLTAQNYWSTRTSHRLFLGGAGLSRFEAQNNPAACNGCQQCIELCQSDALALVEVPAQKRRKVSVDAVKCTGCGLCVFVCEPRSIRMALVAPLGHIATGRSHEP